MLDLDHPSRGDYYLMQIAAGVYGYDRNAIPDFRLNLVGSKPSQEKAMPTKEELERDSMRARTTWMTRLGKIKNVKRSRT